MASIKVPQYHSKHVDRFPDCVIWYRRDEGYGYEAFNDDATATAPIVGREPITDDSGNAMILVLPNELETAHNRLIANGRNVKIITLYA